MSAVPDLAAYFREMEKLVDAQPEGAVAEIARGVYAMSPRPRGRHAVAQSRLAWYLERSYGAGSGIEDPDWLFMIEPEIRSPETFSRIVPDYAGWRRSTSGWPDLDVTPVTLVPDWVAEVLSPATEEYDRGPKSEAYGLMGVVDLWLLDPQKRTLETFSNARSRMVPGPRFALGEEACAAPFASARIPVAGLFAA